MQEKIKNEVWDAICPKCGETDDINCGRLKYDFICNNCNHEWNLIDLTIQKTAQAIFEDIEKDIAKEIKRLDKYEQKYKKKGDKKKERFFRHAILIIGINIRNNIVRVHKKKYTGGD